MKAFYTMPTFHNPLGTTTSLAHRRAVLAIAAAARKPVIEDAYEMDLRYAGKAVAPLAALDTRGVVVQLFSFSKSLFPGARVGCDHCARSQRRRAARTEARHRSRRLRRCCRRRSQPSSRTAATSDTSTTRAPCAALPPRRAARCPRARDAGRRAVDRARRWPPALGRAARCRRHGRASRPTRCEPASCSRPGFQFLHDRRPSSGLAALARARERGRDPPRRRRARGRRAASGCAARRCAPSTSGSRSDGGTSDDGRTVRTLREQARLRDRLVGPEGRPRVG